MNNFYYYLFCFIICLTFSCNTPETSTDSKSDSTPISTEEKISSSDTNSIKENPIKKATTTEEKIAVIRSLYKDIQDNIDDFKTKKKPYTGETEALVSGELTAYMKNGKIVKLSDKAEEDHGPGENEFFFINGTLFFLFSQVMTVEMTEKPNIHVRELRLYFDETGKIIDALVKTKTFKNGENIDMSTVANEKGENLINSTEEAEYYNQLANETIDFFNSKESFDEFYGNE